MRAGVSRLPSEAVAVARPTFQGASGVSWRWLKLLVAAALCDMSGAARSDAAQTERTRPLSVHIEPGASSPGGGVEFIRVNSSGRAEADVTGAAAQTEGQRTCGYVRHLSGGRLKHRHSAGGRSADGHLHYGDAEQHPWSDGHCGLDIATTLTDDGMEIDEAAAADIATAVQAEGRRTCGYERHLSGGRFKHRHNAGGRSVDAHLHYGDAEQHPWSDGHCWLDSTTTFNVDGYFNLGLDEVQLCFDEESVLAWRVAE